MGLGSGKLAYEKVDLTGKTAIVTGANSGIGYVTTRDLMKMGARVIMACRSPTKAEDALQKIRADAVEEFGENTTAHERVEFIKVDLESLHSVMHFVEEFKRKGYPLHLLICNGAVLMNDKEMTEDGNERTFQVNIKISSPLCTLVNYLSHFLMTLHLLPVMRESGEDCRIINVSSLGHRVGVLDPSDIQAEKQYGPREMYGNSKLFQVMSTYSLHRRLKNTNISVYSLHPGIIETPIMHNFERLNFRMNLGIKFARLTGMAVESDQGAMTTLYVATDPQVPEINNGCYFDACKAVAPNSKAKKVKHQEILWNYSLERLRDYVTEDLLKDLRVDQEELGVVKRKK